MAPGRVLHSRRTRDPFAQTASVMRFSPFHALVALSLACAAAPAALAGPVLDRVKATGTIVMG